MADSIIKIEDLNPVGGALKGTAQIPISQDKIDYRVSVGEIEQSVLTKVSDRYIEKGTKIPNENLTFGEVKEGDLNVVSGGAVDLFKKNNKNLFLDSYFKEAIDAKTVFSNISFINTVYDFTLTDFDSKYRKSFLYKGDLNATLNIRFKLSDLGLKDGDVYSVSMLINAIGDTRARFHVFQLDASASRITSVKYSSYVFGKQDFDLATLNDTIIENCTYLDIWLEKYGGNNTVMFTGLSINKGNIAYNYEIPTTYISNNKSVSGSSVSEFREKSFMNRVTAINVTDSVTSLQRNNANVSISEEVFINDKKTYYLEKNTESKEGEVAGAGSIIINNSNFWQADIPSTVIMPIFLHEEDINITQIVLSIRNNKGANVWSRKTTDTGFNTGSLKKGWNLFRWDISNSTVTNFGIDISSFKIDLYSTKKSKINIAPIYFEYVEKAKMMFINDHGRSGGWLHLVNGQTQSGIKDCEDIGMKVTFALNPKKHEQGDSLRFTMTELNTLKESNIAYFSFHSYNATSTQNMSYIDLQNDAKKSINWLQSNGFGKPSFRACFTQNLAKNGMSNFNFMGLDAIATWKENTYRFNGFPLIERRNVKRFEIHNRTTDYLDAYFDDLKKFRGVTVPYTHAIIADNDVSSDSPFSVKLSIWKYFIQKCNEAKNEGWLEFVSYDDLIKELEDFKIQDNDDSIIDRYFNVF